MSVCVIFDATISRDRLVINFQLSAGVAISTGLKPNLYYKCIFIDVLNVVKCHVHISSLITWEFFKVMLCFYSL